MEEFLKTKRGLEYLLETSPSDMPVDKAVEKAVQDYEDEYNDYLEAQVENLYGAGWL